MIYSPLFVLSALAITLLLEGLAALLLVWWTKQPLKLAIYVLAVNTITVPLVWFTLPYLFPEPMAILMAFGVSFVLEAAALAWLFRKSFRIYEAVSVVLAFNIFSFLVGMMILMMLAILV